MLQTTQDLYYAVAAISLAVVSTLLSVALVYILGILKRVDHVTAIVEEGVEAIEEGVEEVRERVSSMANYGKIATRLAESALAMYQNRMGADDDSDDDAQKSGRKRRIR